MTAETAEAIVRSFCTAWEARELEAILAALSEDIVYHNVPAPPLIGRRAVRKFIAPLIESASAIEFELLTLVVASNGDKVLTERLDRLHFAGGVLEIPLMGIFEIRAGQITQWRDYADLASVEKATSRLGVVLPPPG